MLLLGQRYSLGIPLDLNMAGDENFSGNDSTSPEMESFLKDNSKVIPPSF